MSEQQAQQQAEQPPAAPLDVYKIVEAVNERQTPFIAFEYFPPRTPEGVKNLFDRIGRMKAHGPLYVDVTWGAGGSTSDLTMELCVESQKRYGVVSNMHLTCTNMPKEKLDKALEDAQKFNVRNILALRGDPPVGQEDWEPVESGFSCALDLVKYIREKTGDTFAITVAGYPEGHPNRIKPVEEGRELSATEQSRLVEVDGQRFVCSDEDYAAELAYLKEKVDAGAGAIVTQMFFDVDCYVSFVKACRQAGIDVPIIPGIMCITSYGGFNKMTAFCKTRVPAAVKERVEAVKDDADAVKAYGVEFGVEVCKRLLDEGAPGLHFYTLNLEKVVNGILEGLAMGSFADATPAAKEEGSENAIPNALEQVAETVQAAAGKAMEAVKSAAAAVTAAATGDSAPTVEDGAVPAAAQ